MFKTLKQRMRRFRREERGSILAESVIMFPTLFAAVLATFVFFDAYRNKAIVLKANYTIADSVSRQSKYITDTYMVNTWMLHRFLTNSPTLTQVRISIIKYDAINDEHTVVWSRARGGGDPYTDVPISEIGLNKDEIPVMPNEEVLIVVQTIVEYAPQFSVGLGRFNFKNITYTRPRFSPRNVCYSHNGTESGRICSGDST